jgi:hypothetical protein
MLLSHEAGFAEVEQIAHFVVPAAEADPYRRDDAGLCEMAHHTAR